MQTRAEKLQQIIDWAQNNTDIRAVLLTSSLVNPLAPVDELSDLDIELVFDDNTTYVANKNWLNNFGIPIAMIEEDESYFDSKHAMKMVLYADHTKVDFKLYSKPNFLEEVHQSPLCEDWDIGYQVLLDKEGITEAIQKPSYRVSIIKKPTEQKFKQLLNDFWWDCTYVAKCLVRKDIFYAKFMSENNIRTDYMVPLIEWYIASQHDWNITTNKHGRLFKKYLTEQTWDKVTQTFSGSDINENWTALFAMTDFVAAIGRELATKLSYEYPAKLEVDVKIYLKALKTKEIACSSSL
ncbi:MULTISPECIES: AadS family aminoglycoside 6-adenylyltransferase [unclassified Sphingobacterium]|uniref:AadS family aminoglycoside 6-adenylyltransferase n=1 Tax=unclassified Sphingobacterium TaxID=2609468 RepID=UPI0025DC35B4|nr:MULTISPECIES: AadS family aminoglycoside 6-adenylyltransferase [unclassified Sphingobacterium]